MSRGIRRTLLFMRFGTLDFTVALASPELLAAPTAAAIAAAHEAADAAGLAPSDDVLVSAIDPGLADTAAFCAHYDISMADGANCVIVQARRGERTWYAACLVRGSDRADVNGVVRRRLDARKLSFAPMDDAVALTGMEYGGITPIGLPQDWPVLVDEAVVAAGDVVIGSGIRASKVLLPATELAALSCAEVLRLSL